MTLHPSPPTNPPAAPNSFILNNDGYTVERLIHGPQAPYNSVPVWDYSKLGSLFGPSYPFKYYSARTPDELEAILFGDKEFAETSPRNGVTQVVELFLGKLDAPESVLRITRSIEDMNRAKQ